jgi:hypothetical protein
LLIVSLSKLFKYAIVMIWSLWPPFSMNRTPAFPHFVLIVIFFSSSWRVRLG